MAKYTENIQGFQKKIYKNISGGGGLKHPLNSMYNLTHGNFREKVIFNFKMVLYLYKYIYQVVGLYLYNKSPHHYVSLYRHV